MLYNTADKCLIKLQTVINRELNCSNNWLIANKLSINTVKTQFMVVSQTAKNSDSIRLYIDNEELKRTKIYKYLGVWIDEGLNWKAHIAKISSSLSKTVGVYFKIRNYVSMHCLKIVYYSLIQSKLTYGILTWGATTKENLSHLFTIQTKTFAFNYL